MKNVLVIPNYNSGRCQAAKQIKEFRKFLLAENLSYKVINIDEIETINVKDFDTIIAVGGDGTINRILPFISDQTLGIIPCGTANLLAANLGIPDKLRPAIKVIKQNKIKKVDIIEVNSKACILRCGIGYDADIITKTPKKLKNIFGYFSYFIAGILFALKLKNKQYELRIDENKATLTNASCIIVANCANMYKNFVTVGNNAKNDDSLFDVFILKTNNPVAFFIEFLKILMNIRKNSTEAEYFKAKNLKITSSKFNWHIDGEKCSETTELEFLTGKKSINVFFN